MLVEHFQLVHVSKINAEPEGFLVLGNKNWLLLGQKISSNVTGSSTIVFNVTGSLGPHVHRQLKNADADH